MFGYITVHKPELKVKDFETYKGYYCGLCKVLHQKFGMRGQATLTYDLTFVSLLLTGLYEPDIKKKYEHCVLHPTQKHLVITSKITAYTADMNILLFYDKLMDNWKDERSIKSLTAAAILRKKCKEVVQHYPDKSAKIQKCLKQINRCEEQRVRNIDLVSGYFGDVMGELFVFRHDEWEKPLRKMGFYLGKFIYLMDAYEDLYEDQQKGNYNPLLLIRKQADFEKQCETILTMMMTECAREFERLPILLNAEIIRNILYAGVWTRYGMLQQKRKDRKRNDNRSL